MSILAHQDPIRDPAPPAFRRPTPHASAHARRLEIAWDALDALVARARVARGVDVLRAIGAGALPTPPLHHLLGIVSVEIAEGRVTFAMHAHEATANAMGGVQGGVLAALLDSAMGCAVLSVLPEGGGCTTTDLQVRYFRPAPARGGLLRAEATVVHRGRRTAVAEGRVTDAHGQLLAAGTESCLLLDAAWQATPVAAPVAAAAAEAPGAGAP